MKKRSVGRPTLYEPAMAQIAAAAAIQGLTDEAIAARLRVGFRTYCRWKETIAEFSAAISSARRAYMLRSWDEKEGAIMKLERRTNNTLNGREKHLLNKFIEEGNFLEAHPADQEETWIYRGDFDDDKIAALFTQRYGVSCTSSNVKSAREATGRGRIHPSAKAPKGPYWDAHFALLARVEHIERELGIKPE